MTGINRSRNALWRNTPKDDHMTNHAGLPVEGYRPQSQKNIDAVNDNKRCEELLLRVMDDMAADEHVDKRWLAIARTSIEQGFMALNRSIFKPARVTDKV